MARLPLFPLGTVLFPGVRLPLQVFEPRYVQLLGDLAALPPAERAFGVVTLRRGNEVGADASPELATVGTAARLTSIRRAAGGPTGVVLVIETVGERRFRLDSFAADETPYFVGDVTWLEDAASDPVDLARAAARASAAYDLYRTATGGPAVPPAVPVELLAFAIAETVALPVADRQSVLDAGDPVRRLALVARLLQRETLLVGGLRLAPTERYDFGAPSAN